MVAVEAGRDEGRGGDGVGQFVKRGERRVEGGEFVPLLLPLFGGSGVLDVWVRVSSWAASSATVPVPT